MSQSTPPKAAPPADAPHPLEMLYEQHQRKIWGFVLLLVAALGVYYGWQKLEQSQRDQHWSQLQANTGLAARLQEPVELMELGGQMEQWRAQIWGNQIREANAELVTRLTRDLRAVDAAEVQKQLQASKGQPSEPWVLWVAANKAYTEKRWDDALQHAKELETRFPEHLLCVETPYPVQVRELTAAEKERQKKDEAAGRTRPPTEAPEYEPPVRGSMVGQLQAAIESDRGFQAGFGRFFSEPVPDRSETAILQFVDLPEIEIAFFPDAAPEHVKAFKEAFAGGHFKGMRVHLLERARKGSSEDGAAQLVHLGLEGSKDTDRSKWVWSPDEEQRKADEIEFENVRDDGLSFFPGMVAAEQGQDGKSSRKRFFINANDAAGTLDGEYVIFGKVVRGLDAIEELVSSSLADEASETAGRGLPSREFLVESTRLRRADDK